MVNNLFSKERLKVNYERAKPDFSRFSFLYQHAFDDLLDRFKDVNRSFSEVTLMSLDTGCNDTFIDQLCASNKAKKVMQPFLNNDEPDLENIPLDLSAQSCIISHFIHHKVSDLPGHLIQIRRSLRPDGLFMGAMLGGESLFELRQVINEVEASLYDRQVARIHPFADKQQMGELMMRAGFALPVVDSDIIKVSYRDVYHLMHDVKGMGEGYALNQPPVSVSKAFFAAVDDLYKTKYKDPKDNDRIEASFEIIYLLGWAPDESQQKPARRGSGQVSLTDVLETPEKE